MRTKIVLGAGTAILACAATALAQERPYLEQNEKAPKEAVELSLGTGYTQGFGRLRGSAGGAVNDVASAGIAVEGGLGYRIDPRWMIGAGMQYQEFATGSKQPGVELAMDSNAAARGMLATIDATYHVLPYQRLDPFVRLGTGYRFLWEVHGAPNPTVLYHGFDWARLAVGADVRVSPDLAFAPIVGADLNTFLWQNNVSNQSAAIPELRLNTFIYAGVMGRFDIQGDRVEETRTVASR